MSTQLTITNKNRPNTRTTTPEKKGPVLYGDSSWEYFVSGNKGSAGVKNLVKMGLWSRLD